MTVSVQVSSNTPRTKWANRPKLKTVRKSKNNKKRQHAGRK